MGENNLDAYLKRLERLESEINDDSDPDEIMKQVNEVIGDISKDIQVEVKELPLGATLKFINRSNNPDPSFAEEGDSGFDLRAFIDKDVTISEGKVSIIPTGLYFEVEKGLEVQVRTRSGMAANTSMFVLNSPGTVDSRHRGEVKIILVNLDDIPHTIRNGDRIAQGVVCPIYGEGNLTMEKVEKLSETIRGSKGFGSSGTK